MAYNEEKLNEFSSAIAEETDNKIKELEQETTDYERSELQKTKDEAYGRMFTYMQEQVRITKNKYRQSVTKYELETRRDLLSFRNSLAEKVFESSKEELCKFAKSDKYEEFLQERIECTLKEFPCEQVVLTLAADDKSHGEKLKQKFSEISEVRLDHKNHLGGFCLVNEEKNVLVDETFAAKIDGAKQEFYRTCGLNILL